MKLLPPLLVSFALATPCVALGDCPVTLPSSSPVEVPKSESGGTHAWFGSEALAVLIPKDGRWKGMGPSRKFGDKFWVWRRGYEAKSEIQPALTFTGVKLGGGVEPERMQIDKATSAFGPGWNSMLVGMQFPSAGCWQVTARYVYAGITHDLTFVLDVIAEESAGDQR
jgi:hypothetical protein